MDSRQTQSLSSDLAVKDTLNARDSAAGNTINRCRLFIDQTLSKNPGGLRALVTCSNAYASLISVGSLHALPKNEIPTGKPATNPAGTVMWGYPAIAAGLELDPRAGSPFTRSVTHAGPLVGATRASSSNLSITASIPSVRASRRLVVIASRYSGLSSGPIASA